MAVIRNKKRKARYAPPLVREPDPVSPWESGLAGAFAGGTFNFGDELYGAGGALAEGLGALSAGQLPSFSELGKAYTGARDESRRYLKSREEANPLSYGAGELAGGLAIPLPGVAAAKGWKGAAKIGALAGAAQGVGSNEDGTLGGMTRDALMGGAAGGAVGVGLHGLIKGAGALINEGAPSWTDDARRAMENIVRGEVGTQPHVPARGAPTPVAPWRAVTDSIPGMTDQVPAATNPGMPPGMPSLTPDDFGAPVGALHPSARRTAEYPGGDIPDETFHNDFTREERGRRVKQKVDAAWAQVNAPSRVPTGEAKRGPIRRQPDSSFKAEVVPGQEVELPIRGSTGVATQDGVPAFVQEEMEANGRKVLAQAEDFQRARADTQLDRSLGFTPAETPMAKDVKGKEMDLPSTLPEDGVRFPTSDYEFGMKRASPGEQRVAESFKEVNKASADALGAFGIERPTQQARVLLDAQGRPISIPANSLTVDKGEIRTPGFKEDMVFNAAKETKGRRSSTVVDDKFGPFPGRSPHGTIPGTPQFTPDGKAKFAPDVMGGAGGGGKRLPGKASRGMKMAESELEQYRVTKPQKGAVKGPGTPGFFPGENWGLDSKGQYFRWESRPGKKAVVVEIVDADGNGRSGSPLRHFETGEQPAASPGRAAELKAAQEAAAAEAQPRVSKNGGKRSKRVDVPLTPQDRWAAAKNDPDFVDPTMPPPQTQELRALADAAQQKAAGFEVKNEVPLDPALEGRMKNAERRTKGPVTPLSPRKAAAFERGLKESINPAERPPLPWDQRVPAQLPQHRAVLLPNPVTSSAAEHPTLHVEMKFQPSTVEAPGGVGTPGSYPKALPLHPDILALGQRGASAFNENRGWMKHLMESLGLPEFRAAAEVAPTIRGWEATKHVQDVQMANRYEALKKWAKHPVVQAFVEQHKNPMPGRPVIPVEALPAEAQVLFREGFEHIAKQQKYLIDNGLMGPEQVKWIETMKAHGLQWLHRDYHAFLHDRFRADPAQFSRAIQGLVKDAGVTPEVAQQHILEFLAKGMDGVPLQQRWIESRLNREILKHRKQVPSYLRAVAGEVNNPAFVLATSMSEVERLVKQHQVSKAFIEHPGFEGRFWSSTPKEGLSHRVWNDNLSPMENRRSYGEFAGKHVTPELYETLMQAPAPKVQNTMLRWASALSSVFKTAKIGLSPLTYVRDWLSNSTYAAASGLPLWNPRLMPRLRQANQAMNAYVKVFTNSKGADKAARWMEWALADRAVISGMGAEFAGGSEARAIAARIFAEADSAGALEKGFALMNRGRARMGAWKDAMDTHWRLATYIEQVTKGMERLGLSQTDARARAASIVNENFASSGSVSHAFRDLARIPGAVAPFMTWAVDNVRVHKNWLRNAARLSNLKDPLSGQGASQGLNVLMHYGLLAGLGEGARRLAGMTDDDVKAADASMRTSYIERNPLREWLPFRDSKGRMQVVSLGNIMPTATFLRGDPNASWVSRALGNMAMIPFESGMLETPVRNLASRFSPVAPAINRTVMPETELRSFAENAYDLIQSGLERDLAGTTRRAQLWGQLGKYEEPLTPGQAVSRLSGMVVEPQGERAVQGARAELSGKLREIRSQMGRIRATSKTPEEANRRMTVLLEQLRALRSAQGKRTEAIGRVQPGR